MSRTAIKTTRTEGVLFARSDDEAFLTAFCTPNYDQEIMLTDTRGEQEQFLKAQIQKLHVHDEILQLQNSRVVERSSLLKPSEIIQTYRLGPVHTSRRICAQWTTNRIYSTPRTTQQFREADREAVRRASRAVEVDANDAAFNTDVQQYSQLDEGIRNFKRIIQCNAKQLKAKHQKQVRKRQLGSFWGRA